jgi:Co/Zn/Cd efflux system component
LKTVVQLIALSVASVQIAIAEQQYKQSHPKEIRMLYAILVFILGLTPPILSLWMMRKAKERMQARLLAVRQQSFVRVPPRNQLPSDRYYLEGVGYLVGDITCQFNARSAYIRCAVNPSGPCEECRHYAPKQ